MTRAVRPALATALVLGAVLSLSTRAPSAQPKPAAAGFVNIAPRAGIDFRHVNGASPDRHLSEIMSGGGLFFDYDGDGWVDVFLVDGGSLADPAVGQARAAPAVPQPRQRHLRGRHGAIRHRASRRTAWAPARPTTTTTARRSLRHQRRAEHAVPQQRAARRFTDVTRRRPASAEPRSAPSCAFADVDRDGDVDLFVTNYVDARVDNNVFCGDAGAKLRVYCHPLNFAPLPKYALPQQRRRHLYRRQPEVGSRQPPRQRPRRRRRRLRR